MKYATVDDYVAAQAPDAQAMLGSIRAIVVDEVPGVAESIRYDMPVFGVDGRYVVHAAAWKRHLGIYPVPRFEGDLEAAVAPLRTAKDTVQFRYRDEFPADLFRLIVRALAAERLTGA